MMNFKAILPVFIRRKIDSREGIREMSGNFSWLLADKILKMTVVMAVNILVTRYLGDVQTGIWNYAIAFVTIFSPLANMGIDGIVIRNIVNNPSRTNEMLGVSFILKALGAIVTVLLSVVSLLYVEPANSQLLWFVLIISFSYIFTAFDTIDLYNQAHLQSKYTVLSKAVGYIFTTFLKIYFILSGYSLIWFVGTLLLENMIGAGIMVYWFKKMGNSIFKWHSKYADIRELLMQSWPLILTSMMMIGQQNVDQIFIGKWIGDAELGQYSTAAKLITLFGFIPMIIQSTVGPEIAKAKVISEDLYYLKLTKLYGIMFIVSISLIVGCFLFGNWGVTLLYGSSFAQAGALMGVLSLRLFFVNYGVAKTLFITNDNLFKYFMLTGVVGIVTNILLNYFLMPLYGSYGAAWASIISLILSIFIIDIFNKHAHRNLRAMVISMINVKSYFKVVTGR